MANYWTFKFSTEHEDDELRTVKPWEETVSNGDKYIPSPKPKSMLELSAARYSVRSYKPQQISKEQLQYVLECTRLAPSAVNKQPWHFYVCNTKETLDKVCQTYRRDWIQTAPTIIVCCICHDEEWVRKIDGHPHGIVDISIAAEHICLSAAEIGLGTCWVCNFDAALCHQLLGLPENQEPAVLIPIGYPATDEVPEKTRKSLDDIVTMLD